MKRFTFTRWLAVITFSGCAQHTMAHGVVRFSGSIVNPTCALQVGHAGLKPLSSDVQDDAWAGRLVKVDGLTLRVWYDYSDPVCGKAGVVFRAQAVLTDAATSPTGVILVVNVP